MKPGTINPKNSCRHRAAASYSTQTLCLVQCTNSVPFAALHKGSCTNCALVPQISNPISPQRSFWAPKMAALAPQRCTHAPCRGVPRSSAPHVAVAPPAAVPVCRHSRVILVRAGASDNQRKAVLHSFYHDLDLQKLVSPSRPCCGVSRPTHTWGWLAHWAVATLCGNSGAHPVRSCSLPPCFDCPQIEHACMQCVSLTRPAHHLKVCVATPHLSCARAPMYYDVPYAHTKPPTASNTDAAAAVQSSIMAEDFKMAEAGGSKTYSKQGVLHTCALLTRGPGEQSLVLRAWRSTA